MIIEPLAIKVRLEAHAALLKVILLLETENALLREEIAVTDGILAERQRVLEAIPPCELHGSLCIPHALEWIADRTAESNCAG